MSIESVKNGVNVTHVGQKIFLYKVVLKRRSQRFPQQRLLLYNCLENVSCPLMRVRLATVSRMPPAEKNIHADRALACIGKSPQTL